MCELIGELTALRRRFPQLRPRRFVGGRQPDGSYGVLWMTPRATEMTEQDWNFPEGRFLAYALGGLEQIKALEQPKPPLYIVLNAAPQTIDFVFPTLPDCSRWTLELTTTAAAGRKGTVLDCGTKWPAPARSVMVFAGTP
jgi:glycogen operon protein